MKKKFIQITFLISLITSVTYSVFIFLSFYNTQENVEKRCLLKFKKEVKKIDSNSDEEWGFKMDIANDNYFKCMKIP